MSCCGRSVILRNGSMTTKIKRAIPVKNKSKSVAKSDDRIVWEYVPVDSKTQKLMDKVGAALEKALKKRV